MRRGGRGRPRPSRVSSPSSGSSGWSSSLRSSTEGVGAGGQRPRPTSQHVLDSRWVRQLDRDYDLVDARGGGAKRATDEAFISGVLGGVLGAGRAVISGFFQVFTVLVLTLYFLTALPRIKHAAFATVPASRRSRVTTLSEEIMRRTGSYALGQVAVAHDQRGAVLGHDDRRRHPVCRRARRRGRPPRPHPDDRRDARRLPSSAVIAFFTDPTKALIAAIYYLVYQQLENYVIAPRDHAADRVGPRRGHRRRGPRRRHPLRRLGALLAIPVAAGLLLLYEEVLVPRQQPGLTDDRRQRAKVHVGPLRAVRRAALPSSARASGGAPRGPPAPSSRPDDDVRRARPRIPWWQPGHRYARVADAPLSRRTYHGRPAYDWVATSLRTPAAAGRRGPGGVGWLGACGPSSQTTAPRSARSSGRDAGARRVVHRPERDPGRMPVPATSTSHAPSASHCGVTGPSPPTNARPTAPPSVQP